MVVDTEKIIQYRFSFHFCTLEEALELIKDIGILNEYEGAVSLTQEYEYDCDGFSTSTGLYKVVLETPKWHDHDIDMEIKEATETLPTPTTNAIIDKILQS